METTTLVVAATLVATPEEVFQLLMSSAEHSALTGAESRIDGRVGGRFSHFGGGLTGVFEEVEPAKRILQRLRAADWPEGHHASLTDELAPIADGQRAHAKVVEDGVPTTHVSEVLVGWQGYWEAFAVYLRERRVDVVRRFVEGYKNRQNPDVVDHLVTRDCAVHIPLRGLPQGREGMRIEGDIVIERAKAEATHGGRSSAHPPRGEWSPGRSRTPTGWRAARSPRSGRRRTSWV